MKKLTVKYVNASAALALCWCVVFGVAQARAEDQLRAAPTIQATQERRVILPAMKVGGFIDGRSVLITERGAEIVTRDQLAHKQIMVLGPSLDPCMTR